jgi:hypothetical protein
LNPQKLIIEASETQGSFKASFSKLSKLIETKKNSRNYLPLIKAHFEASNLSPIAFTTRKLSIPSTLPISNHPSIPLIELLNHLCHPITINRYPTSPPCRPLISFPFKPNYDANHPPFLACHRAMKKNNFN